MNLSVYQNGRLTESRTIAICKQANMRTAGMIALVPDEGENIKVIITEGEEKISSEVQLLESVADVESLIRTVSSMPSSVDVLKGDEVELVGFSYSKDEAAESDYTYLFTAAFQ